MANEDVLGPRKTMFVLVIVVGCFAVLWPRILSPLILGNTRDQLKPNQHDRDAGCCEVIFEPEVAVLELVNELCSTAVGIDGRLSALAAAECRKSVNETCGVDIIEFLKRTDNVGKNTKRLVETMKISNSSCLRENFGVPVWSLSEHSAWNTGAHLDTLKQERPLIRGAGPHPALQERGRAIPPGAPTPPSRGPVQLPPHARVRTSALSGYFELDIKPPPIPGMRPPLGSPGGPVPAPKSSMGFVMPIYTICIIVFFVYTLSKILFKRTGTSPYEPISPDPQFRRRVFRDDSRTSPDTKLVVTAISGLVAEVQQQMEANYAQSQQRQEAQENHTRPYTNGTVLNTNPTVQIIATEYREPTKEKTPEPEMVKEPSPEPKEPTPEPVESTPETKKSSDESREFSPEPKEPSPEPKEPTPEPKEPTPEPKELTPEPKEPTPEPKEPTPEPKEPTPEPKEPTPEPKEPTPEPKDHTPELKELSREITPESDDYDDELMRITENIARKEIDKLTKASEDLINEARGELKVVSTLDLEKESDREKRSTSELLEEALKEDSSKSTDENDTEGGDQENGSVKVVGMEVTAHSADGGAWPLAAPRPRTPAAPIAPAAPARPAHEAEEVKSIYLETEIPQQSRVLVTDFVEDTDAKPLKPTKKHSPLVVSGKMTLSLIQDDPRDTPERDTVSESTMDEFTTASAITQPAAEKEDDELSEEEIEIEEIEEEVEEEEEEEEPQETVEVKKKVDKVARDE